MRQQIVIKGGRVIDPETSYDRVTDVTVSDIGSPVFDPGCFERWKSSYGAILAAEGKYRGSYCDESIFNDLRKNYPETIVVAFADDLHRRGSGHKLWAFLIDYYYYSYRTVTFSLR